MLVRLAFVLFLVSAWAASSGCAHVSAQKLEARPVVAHYESQSDKLQKKERSGSEGGCPTCVY